MYGSFFDGYGDQNKAEAIYLLKGHEPHIRTVERFDFINDDKWWGEPPNSYVKYMEETFGNVAMEDAIAFLGPPPKAEDLPAWLTEPLPEAPPAECEPRTEALIKRFQRCDELGLDVMDWLTKDPPEEPKAVKPRAAVPLYDKVVTAPELGMTLFTQMLGIENLGGRGVELEKVISGRLQDYRVGIFLDIIAKKYFESNPQALPGLRRSDQVYEDKEEIGAATHDLMLMGKDAYRKYAFTVVLSEADFLKHPKLRGFSWKRIDEEIVDPVQAVVIKWKTPKVLLRLPGEEEKEAFIHYRGFLVGTIDTVENVEREHLTAGQRKATETKWLVRCSSPFILAFLNDLKSGQVRVLPECFTTKLPHPAQELLRPFLAWAMSQPWHFTLLQAQDWLGWKKPKTAALRLHQINRIKDYLQKAKDLGLIGRYYTKGRGKKKSFWFTKPPLRSIKTLYIGP